VPEVVLQARAGEVPVRFDRWSEVGMGAVGACVQHADAHALALDRLAIDLDAPGILGVRKLQCLRLHGGLRSAPRARLAERELAFGPGRHLRRRDSAVVDDLEDVAVFAQSRERGL